MSLKKIYGLEKIKDSKLKKNIEKQAKEMSLLHNTDELALVQNPNYIYPSFELYPLAKKNTKDLKKLNGVVKDMDGTTTTTETLCIHSLEHMMRRVTDRMDAKVWPGLDSKKDYPHIIGDSSTKHIEYLLKKYASDIKEEAFKKSFFEAACWTLRKGKDEQRQEEVINKLNNWDLKEVILSKESPEELYDKHGHKFSLKDLNSQVQASLDIYYHRYHEIIGEIAEGRGDRLKKELTGGKRLIEPMPGIEIYIALLKGWLGEKLDYFFPFLKKHLLEHGHLNYSAKELNGFRPVLKKLGKYFQKNPAKIAVVTSSIKYEADIVLSEVFKVIREKISEWEIDKKKKKRITEKFKDFRNVYDGYITASDSSEIRLKPHRDLYCLALHQLGFHPNDFSEVVGFEDSEAGLIAIRAAGIGKSVAVPFADTHGHDLSSASYCLFGGIPEVILVKHAFIDPNQLK